MSNTSQKSTDLTAKPLTTMSGHEDYIRRIAYLPGGKRVVTCAHDKTVRIWDVEKGKQEGTSMVHEGWLHGLAVTRDGKRILSGGKDGRINVWDVETHEQIEEWASHAGRIWCIALSPDDQLAASGAEDGKIVIREMKEHGEIKHSIDAGRRVESLDFSPNGEKLAYGLFSASHDRTIRCWDPETGESIGEPWTGHMGGVSSLSLSPDGTKLASASYDNTVRFWNSRSGDPIEHPLQHEDPVYAVAFSPSGEFVASAGGDGKLSIWRVPWWDDSQKQVITVLTYLPTRFLTMFLVADTPFLARRALSAIPSHTPPDNRLLFSYQLCLC
ncbi:hypothetical protein PAXINDRAFT_87685 [Paxillus involutus ATCC 200175]|uniref:WD40 repeat-like protein n=1 Tax=Paxillus involutus ATCC 200175 TaxID=664439 RepID=A0A0C9TQ48_PAXIN|nr:hypothetical protein PAXINDRAFT_87685 [Paxillus involutus ATCC 200175]